MDVRRLEAFCKVYELNSFSKAGQDLFLSQPTISAHIATLEQELGIPLFDRLGRTVIATQAGDILYRYTREAFSSLDNAKAEIQLLQERIAGEITVGGSTIPSTYLLPRLLAKFAAKYPDVRIKLRTGDTRAIIEQVSEGDLVLGVVGDRDESSDLTFAPIMKDELIVVGAPSVVQATSLIGTKEICTWPWLLRESGSGTLRAFEKGLMAIGLDMRCLNVAVTVDSTEAVLQCVRAGLGVSVTSRLAAETFLERGEIVEVKVPFLEMNRSFYTVYHPRRHFFPVFRYFMDFLELERKTMDGGTVKRTQAVQAGRSI